MKDHNFCEPGSADIIVSTGTGATTIQPILKVEIQQYEPEHQSGIEALVLPIQQHEFGVGITREEQPDLLNIPKTFLSKDGNFWVAIADNRVIGSIGLVDIDHKEAALKKMFVHRDFRGKQAGVSSMLILTAKQWAIAKGMKAIYLGTVTQMAAAQRFYEKNGFVEVSIPELPASFPLVHVDTKFYRCDLI